MLRAASLATLTVPRLLRSITAGAWRKRSIACADAARAVVSLPCCWQMLGTWDTNRTGAYIRSVVTPGLAVLQRPLGHQSH